jgi:putative intracellular protease/amidase
MVRSRSHKEDAMNVLMVLTSHDQLGASGKKTGLWLEEFAAPYYELIDAGATVVLASPKGGQAPIDPTSDEAAAQTNATARYHDDPATQRLLSTTKRLSEVNASSFSAVFYPGGHGPLWDLVDDPVSLALLAAFDAEGKPIAVVCHAPIALKNLMTDAGGYFLSNRNVTGFSNSEESAVGLADVVPELLEDTTQRAQWTSSRTWSSMARSSPGRTRRRRPKRRRCCWRCWRSVTSNEVARRTSNRLRNKRAGRRRIRCRPARLGLVCLVRRLSN